jgi:Protein of unknown function (DUF3617)
MSKWKNCIASSGVIVAAVVLAQSATTPPPAPAAPPTAATQDRKPGLYELTLKTSTTQPKSSTLPPRTHDVCLTQEMIDKYGAIVPDNVTKVCQLANVVKKPGGMTADIVCSGAITGGGTLKVNWDDAEHAKGEIHFSGTMQPGADVIKIEWSATTDSVYKGPDCGELKSTPPK